MGNGINSLEGAKSELINLAIHFGPKLFTAIVILTIGGFAAGWGRPRNRTRAAPARS